MFCDCTSWLVPDLIENKSRFSHDEAHTGWTCLDAQQSMAKQPINGCVSNHSRMWGKSVSEKSE